MLNCIPSVGVTLLFSGTKKKKQTFEELLVNRVTSQSKIFLAFTVVWPFRRKYPSRGQLVSQLAV